MPPTADDVKVTEAPEACGLGGLAERVATIIPVPLKGTSSVGVSGSLDGIDREALFPPDMRGEKIIPTVHMADVGREYPEHVSVWIRKSPALVPERVTVPMRRLARSLFETVIACTFELEPALMTPKSREAGVAVILGT